MKKLLAATAAAGIVLGAFAGPASAVKVDTPIGQAGINEAGYIVYADGNATNPAASSGYVSVRGDGQVCADDNGGRNADGTWSSSSPTCSK